MDTLPTPVASNPPCVDDESRRTFLAAVGLTVAGSALAPSTAGTDLSASPAVARALVLGHADLLVPPGESYVAWRVDPAATPLLAHLGAAVAEFDPALAPAGAFVARRGTHAPRYVETAALPPRLDRSTVVAAVDEWLAATHGPDLVHTETTGGVAWHVTRDGWTEAVTLRAVGDRLLLVCAGGRADAPFAPGIAADHYARLLAERAGGAA